MEVILVLLSDKNFDTINCSDSVLQRKSWHIYCKNTLRSKLKSKTHMKKTIITLVMMFCAMIFVQAQKVALVDMDYIMKSIPAYETASDQLNQVSAKWKKEVDALNTEVKNMYDNYQTEIVFLSKEMQVKRENEIYEKEKAVQELKRKYFGKDGELFKKRESLMKPIQDEVYNAVKSVADENSYQLVLDKSSAVSIVYAVAKIDISDEVLTKLGYAK